MKVNKSKATIQTSFGFSQQKGKRGKFDKWKRSIGSHKSNAKIAAQKVNPQEIDQISFKQDSNLSSAQKVFQEIPLHHGSNVKVTVPNVKAGGTGKDFGEGFYLTDSYKKAEARGNQKVKSEHCGCVTISNFIYSEELAYKHNLKIKIFIKCDKEWARFVILNRKNRGKEFTHEYDIVIGPVADGKYPNRLIDSHIKDYGDRYLDDDSLERFIDKINQYGTTYMQYVFCTERALKALKIDNLLQ